MIILAAAKETLERNMNRLKNDLAKKGKEFDQLTKRLALSESKSKGNLFLESNIWI